MTRMISLVLFILVVGYGRSLAAEDAKFSPVDAKLNVLPTNISNTNASRRSFFSAPNEVTLGFVMRNIGMIECHLTDGNFFETLLGQTIDTPGNYLCGPTCDGICVPNQDVGVAPVSLYPFGCKCAANRCTDEGPEITHFGTGRFQIICVRDTRCSCDGMGEGHHLGYLCNWMNLNTHKIVSFLDRPAVHLHPTYSPIRWCSCCPQISGPFPSGHP